MKIAVCIKQVPTREWQPRAGRGGTPPPPRQIREVFFCATREARDGVIYLKVVNASGTAQRISVQISGASKIRPAGEVVTLAAATLNDTNSLEQPQNIVPRTEKALDLSAQFTRDFPAYSVTVLKLRSK